MGVGDTSVGNFAVEAISLSPHFSEMNLAATAAEAAMVRELGIVNLGMADAGRFFGFSWNLSAAPNAGSLFLRPFLGTGQTPVGPQIEIRAGDDADGFHKFITNEVFQAGDVIGILFQTAGFGPAATNLSVTHCVSFNRGRIPG